MRKIILPQLIRIALPGLGNLWMILLKDTALVSVIGLTDILRQTGIAAGHQGSLPVLRHRLPAVSGPGAAVLRGAPGSNPRAKRGGEPMSIANELIPPQPAPPPPRPLDGLRVSRATLLDAVLDRRRHRAGALSDRRLGHRQGRDLRPEIPFRPVAPR
jgi:hypothetical protein